MKSISSIAALLALSLIFSFESQSQSNIEDRFKALIGEWEGSGEGFSSSTSTIRSSFTLIMDGLYLEVKNNSKFQPTEKYPKGENHLDQGIISYDQDREVFVFRQFHIEGYVIRYVLSKTHSTDTSFVFESELIDNFVEGGKTKWTIIVHASDHIESIFDVSFPGREFACFGTNQLWKQY